jgi:hypothetical protein
MIACFHACRGYEYAEKHSSCRVDAVTTVSGRDVEFLARAVTRTRERASTTAIDKAGKFA